MLKVKQLIEVSTLWLALSLRASMAFMPSERLSIRTLKQDGFALSAASATTSSSRQKRVARLTEWGASNEVKTGGVAIQSIPDSGLGLVSTQEVPSGSLLVTVPASVTLSVTSGSLLGGPDDISVEGMCTDRRTFRELPWLNNVSSIKLETSDLKPWLESLPNTFDTPIRWEKSQRDDLLQYQHMSESVDRQKTAWTNYFDKLNSALDKDIISWDQFLLGCELARSRAFSGGYTGSPFNPLIYAFTLLLVTVYAGLGLGTLEQAANGAALVFCASVLRDFVVPKLFKTKKYVICPIIDMANHRSVGPTANVAYEFFTDAYSLSATVQSPKDTEIFISYGERSNDQLLQYYGFVEPDNPYDLYVMPPIREWDIASLEVACGRPFASGRLEKLDRAGLLGKPISAALTEEEEDDGEISSSGNPRGGVVLTRAAGIDPAVIQALRALVSTDEEWEAAGEAVGNFAAMVSTENEQRARLAARTALEQELQAKPTTLEEDQELLKRSIASRSSSMDDTERLAVQFRIEKKKILQSSINMLK
eukprot:scaffold596_cov87-Cylindrotheca_fusiformis.AAC.4